MFGDMKYIALTLSTLLLAGCSGDQDARSRLSRLETQVSLLETRLATSEAQTHRLSRDLWKVQLDTWSKIESESAAVVSPSSKGYAIARNEYGTFPVIIEDAQPYLDGHKIKLRIGNLISAAMTGVKLELVYGGRDPEYPTRDATMSEADTTKAFAQYTATVDQNKKSRRTLIVDAGKDIAPASWTIVEAIISPSKAEDLGRIEVKVKVEGMKLSNPR